MAESAPRPLHLHTLDSLLADLVSGRAVTLGDGATFVLSDDRARSALQWYRKRGAANWSANVSAAHGEELVDAIQFAPPNAPALPARPANANKRRLTLTSLKAHRFAGIHKFGTVAVPPPDYVHDFSAPVTLFEGRNGSGKTSLVNAILWALTGEILRPQREPEKADEEFECLVDGASPGQEPTGHRLTPVTPTPDVDQYRPDQDWVPADTWVELTFVDENGTALPPIRRCQRRTTQGRLEEVEPDLTVLGVDPIAVRIGTVMPGLLPLIRVGHESELGRAVAQLTGLSALTDLAGHVQRAKTKIDKEFIKSKSEERNQIDRHYETARADLQIELKLHPSLIPPTSVPAPSDNASIEVTLDEILQHFEGKKAGAFDSVRSILGDEFDPSDSKRRSDLEKSITPALSDVAQPQRLPSMARLRGFRELTDDQLSTVKAKISEILVEAATLDSLAKDPSSAARARLYARIAMWLEDHPDLTRDENSCVVCGGSLTNAIDPVSGKSIKSHIHDAMTDAALLSQTLSRWSKATLGDLTRSLPPSLQGELGIDLPRHPCDLIRKAIIDELFALDSFSGELAKLKIDTAKAFAEVIKQSPALPDEKFMLLPADCEPLERALKRLDLALRFSDWRRDNDVFARKIFEYVLGRRPKDGAAERGTLIGKLLELNGIVVGAEPITKALVLCGRLKEEMKLRRATQKRLAEYQTACTALASLLQLGDLADRQVDELRSTLRIEAQKWRSRIYVSSFPSLAHELVDTSMGKKGQLGLVVKSGGVSAPAQHVANASALRASLVGFFFAFWEHVIKNRGGLQTLALDDPQELLDDENRERLAASFEHLIGAGAQLVVTSYDHRFAGAVAHIPGGGAVEHLAVHPATLNQPVIRTTPHETEIKVRKAIYDEDRDAEEPARSFTDGCRVFLEAVLGDVFEDPAHLPWAKENPHPTLAAFVSRLRPHISAGLHGMFAMPVFKDFIAHPAVVDNSPVLKLMNKAHHGNRQDIRPGEVAECADDLVQLVNLAGRMYEECSRWKRRDAVKAAPGAIALPPPLSPMPTPALRLIICPDLAAFTQHAPAEETQEAAEPFDPQLLGGKCVFFLRRPNFGFAAPQGALAIVEALPGPVLDRRLVIARHGKSIYARRFLRPKDSDIIGLTAEIPDPRRKSPTTLILREAEVALHQVAGVLFDHDIIVGQGQDEAVLVDADQIFERIEIAFRVVDESAVPLALPQQIVLGGPLIDLAEIRRHEDALVALTLNDGSSIFKRVGSALSGDLAHLRQFESIGGLGSSQVLAIGETHAEVRCVRSARRIIGVIYHG
jgi:hypothetical protein